MSKQSKQLKPELKKGQEISRRDFLIVGGAAIASAAFLNAFSSCSSTETVTATTTTTKTATATTTAVTTVTPVPTSKAVTDMAGRQIVVPTQVDRVATLVGSSYDSVYMLGGAGKIVAINNSQNKWAQLLNPAVAKIPTIANFQAPNVEDLLSKQVQAVFFWNYPDPLKKMADAGLPAVVSLAAQENPTNKEDFVKSLKDCIKLYADVLGGDAGTKLAAYNKYIDDQVARISAVTSKIPDNQKLSMYYVRGAGPLTVNGAFSTSRWWAEIAGANYVTKELQINTYTDVSIEQVIVWNPDVIIMAVPSSASITADAKWANIKAVKNGKVFVTPCGEIYWDAGVEGPLLMLFMAKTLYPDKFPDIDMVKEVKSFYAQFFGYTLTDAQANLILAYKDPA